MKTSAWLVLALANDGDAATTVAGFSGYIDRGSVTGEDADIPAGHGLAGAELTLYLDANANGVFDGCSSGSLLKPERSHTHRLQGSRSGISYCTLRSKT